MKLLRTTLVFLAATIIQSLAMADSIVCTDLNSGADTGWKVEISKGTNLAQVFELTIAGPQLRTTLIHGTCDNQPAHPNVPVTTYYYEQYLRDAGFSLTFEQGGFVGIGMASLYEVTFFGSTQITTLVCRTEF